jgi:hypothetical protein
MAHYASSVSTSIAHHTAQWKEHMSNCVHSIAMGTAVVHRTADNLTAEQLNHSFDALYIISNLILMCKLNLSMHASALAI